MQANHTMQMTKIERPALGLLSLVGELGTLVVLPTSSTTTRGDSNGITAYRALSFVAGTNVAGTNVLGVTSINQHAAKQVRRFNVSDWKRSIRRPRKPRVANG